MLVDERRGSGQTLEWGERSGEERGFFYQGIFSRAGRENLKAQPQGKREGGVLNRIGHYRRVEETLKTQPTT
jgi:hypothetical protein